MRKFLFAVALLCVAIGVGFAVSHQSARAQEKDKLFRQPAPIMANYDMMDIMMDPLYEQLKDAVVVVPERRKHWRALYISTFPMAELFNLLLFRDDEEYMLTEKWDQLAVESRDIAKSLGEAIRAKDYEAIKKQYVVLIKACNACHLEFVDEEDATEVDYFDTGMGWEIPE